VGAALAEHLFATGMNPFVMMEVAAGILLVHLALYRAVNRRMSGAAARPVQEPMKAGNGFSMVFASRYLGLIALLLVLLNVANTVGEYILSQAVVEAADARVALDAGFDKGAFIGTFYGGYLMWTSLAAIVLQAFVVSRIVKRFGLSGAVLALPLVALVSYGLAAVGVALAVLRTVKIAENSTDYSVMNTAKQMLWLNTTREEKYKAKQAIDTFFVRAGDMLAAGVVFLGTHLLPRGAVGFARFNVLVVLAAIFVAVLLVRESRRLNARES